LKLAASLTLLTAATMAQANCGRCAPIFNVSNAATTNASGKTLTNDQIKAAIIRAGAGLGWQMKDEGPGKIVATLLIRKHTAVVEIPYSPSGYSINYLSSVNLDESGGQIHKNYNGWIQNLTRGINSQLSGS
jgi:hypothetical protein